MKEKKGLGEIGRREERREGRERRRIVMMMMMVMMVMGCNSGGVGESKESVENRFLKSLVGLSNEFLNVFTSFGEMVGSVLGLKTDSKKSDVAAYFKTVQDTVQGAKDGLNKIVNDMKEEKNPNAEATEAAVKKFVSETLDKIIEGAKTASGAIGVESNDLLANIADNAAGAMGIGVENLVKGIKSIVEIVLKDIGKADAGTDKKADNLTARTANAADGEAGKLFVNAAIANDPKKSAADAAKAVGAVTGADILKAMIKDGGDAVKLATNNTANNSGANSVPKDATIAGGIALRAMAKGGKFSNGNDADAKKTIVDSAISVVNKVLNTLTVAMKNTVDEGLKTVKEAMKLNVAGGKNTVASL
ncbi:Variable outer membrane protein (plasmid) [Borrelia crocidurae DOU]|uniref:Variable large protein n=1 Tax=Borrelia crocidurae DOU TaxID=1293575 RepID=W5SLD6_9SPIR|nr:variable large family protein [Borrelia crocidurae]AHH07695.1 Variable outer membrane protein [Borrelia crocidurae DOU]